jgi:hypothetical protein
VDLADQDQAVAHDDSRQADQAQDGVEAERLVEDQQGGHDADQGQGRGQQHHPHRRQRPDLEDDHDHHQDEHQREDRRQRRVGLAGLLDVRRPSRSGSRRAGRGDRLERLHHLGRDVRRLEFLGDVAAHGDGGQAVAAAQDRILHADLGLADLVERHALAARADQGEGAEPRRIQPIAAAAAGDHLDGADVLAHLGDGRAGQQELQLLGGVMAGEAHGAQAVLVEHEMDGRDALAPVGVDLAHGLVGSMTPRTCSAISRTLAGSGPMTRNATGQGEGGPKTIWVARTRAPGPSPAGRTAGPAASGRRAPFRWSVSTTILANDGSGSSGDMARKKRGAPWPI